jgi:diguanylate cyclase (GGDEF)-like protein/PAS domain S-box-containing protein/putative nucleotidyltransferase with HDIG domain
MIKIAVSRPHLSEWPQIYMNFQDEKYINNGNSMYAAGSGCMDFSRIVMSAPDGILIIDKSYNVCFCNYAAEVILGKNIGQLRNIRVDIPFDILKTVEHVIHRYNSESIVLEIRSSETDWNGKPAYLLFLRDITSCRHIEDLLRKSKERYEIAVNGSMDGLWDWNVYSGEIYYSPRWKSMLGYEDSEIGSTFQDWFEKIHTDDCKNVKNAIDAFMNGSLQHFDKEYRMIHKNGSVLWVLCRGAAIRDDNGKVCRITGFQTDITQRKNADSQLDCTMNDLKFALASEQVLLDELDKRNKELIELSLTDGLTGLYNHRFIQERFEFEFKRIKRYGGHLSCMMIDIDHFKHVNDTYGHQFGDYVLKEIAKIIQTKSREVDICARYGGEEFLIVTNVIIEYAMIFASKLHTAIEKYIFEYDGKSAHVTVSIGLADYTADMKSRHEMIEHADEALYQAKEDGRNLIRIWKESRTLPGMEIDHISVQELKTKFVSLSMQMRASYMDYTNALIKAVDSKDPYTKEHSHNVAEYSVAIACEMGLEPQDIEIIKYASLLHDIGKIAVPQEILLKTSPLSPEEYMLLQKHPVVGVTILKDIKFLEKEIPIILHHHERYDGKGYPHGLMGREIPAGARIVAAADAYDAMTSGRGYKGKLSVTDAVAELKKGSGYQFSPEVILAFVNVIWKKYLNVPDND